MAVAHRYWRLNISSAGGSCGLSSLELRSVSGGSNLSVTGNGTASASDEGMGASASAFDNNLSTYWLTDFIGAGWLKWDFGAGNAQAIASMTIVDMPSGMTSNSPKIAVLEWSDDNTNWVSHITMANPSSDALETNEYLYVYGEIDVTLPMLTASVGTGAGLDVVLPMLALDCSVGAPRIEFTLPALVVEVQSASEMNLLLPGLQVAVSVVRIPPSAVEVLLPAIEASMSMGAEAVMSLPALFAQVQVAGYETMRVEVTLPTITTDTRVLSGGVARVDLDLPALLATAAGGAQVAAVLPVLAVSVEVGSGAAARVNVVLPAIQSGMTVGGAFSARIDVELPALAVTPFAGVQAQLPTLSASMVVGAVAVTVTYEAYAVNLQPSAGYRESAVHEVTRYTGMRFNQVIRYQGRHYGIADTGIYLLGGETDAGAPIPWAWRTAVTNFGSRQQSVVREGFLNGRLGPSVKATVSIGEQAEATYAAVLERGRAGQAHRIKYGRGLKAQYWSFGLESAAGGPCDIDSMLHEPQPISRKV